LASLDTQNSREGSRFTVGMKARGFWIAEACEVNVQKCERRAESQGLLRAQLLGKSWNLTPRSQLKFLYLYLIIGILYPHTTGSIEVVVAMVGVEAHAGCFFVVHGSSRSFTLPKRNLPCAKTCHNLPSLNLVPFLARIREPIISGDHSFCNLFLYEFLCEL
jgi:hypothetical protein